jgi:hypothetical protein
MINSPHGRPSRYPGWKAQATDAYRQPASNQKRARLLAWINGD